MELGRPTLGFPFLFFGDKKNRERCPIFLMEHKKGMAFSGVWDLTLKRCGGVGINITWGWVG